MPRKRQWHRPSRRVAPLNLPRQQAPLVSASTTRWSADCQHLTKSRYIEGLQCLRRLWLLDHEPLPYEEPAPGSPLDMGQEIGRKAHLLFPDGAPINEEPWQKAQAVAGTAAMMIGERVPAILRPLSSTMASASEWMCSNASLMGRRTPPRGT